MTTTPPTEQMPIGQEAIEQAARRLADAAAAHTPCAPVRDLLGASDVAAAYAVQQHNVRRRLAGGARIVGRKIGLTSPAVQAQLGVDRPDFGVLFDDMDVTGTPVAMARLIQPKAEAEVAFVLAEDLADGPLSIERLRAAIARTYVALEIVDSRIRDWDIRFADTVADNGSSALFALGTELHGVEPKSVAMTMTRNGDVVSRGSGDACLGDPRNALRWLARTARDVGDPLRAGQLVLSGALGPMTAVTAGDRVRATLSIDGSPVGSVSADFTGGPR